MALMRRASASISGPDGGTTISMSLPTNQVMWALSVRTRASDIVVLPEMPGIPIDPAAVIPGKGHRLIIDATTHVPPDPVGNDIE